MAQILKGAFILVVIDLVYFRLFFFLSMYHYVVEELLESGECLNMQTVYRDIT